MELKLEKDDVPMPRSRPVKRLSDGEIAELRALLIDLLDRGWIQHSTVGHEAAVVFVRKPDSHLLRLQGPQRHHAAGSRAALAHRRAAGRHTWVPLPHQA